MAMLWKTRSRRIGTLAVASALALLVTAGCGRPKEQASDNEEQMAKPVVTVYAADADKQKFSSGIPASVSLAEAMKPEKRQTPLCVAAKVEEVCQKKGCWMILTDGEHSIRVTFRDYGFFVPKDIAGTTIKAQGIIEESVLSEADARHYAEDSGASESEIQAIVGDQKEYTMVADAVFIEKI